MIKTKKDLKQILEYEKKLYSKYMYPTFNRRFWGYIKHEPIIQIWKWQKTSRYSDYYKHKLTNTNNIFFKILYLYYIRKRNKLGLKLGIEIETYNIGRGLFIYHYSGGIVINGNSYIGENFHLHGNNCIGNLGLGRKDCPVIGDNVMLGVGAKVLGNVKIANNVKIAAGAVVVKDVVQENCVVVGVPAKIKGI